MKARAVLPYSKFKALIPAPFRTKRDPKMKAFKEAVGEQAKLFRNLHLPVTNTQEARHQRWRDWIEGVHFDESWETINSLDDDLINDMAKGKRAVEYAVAVYYRLHAELDHPRYAEKVDEAVFEEPLAESGVIVFEPWPATPPLPQTSIQPRLEIKLADRTDETRFLFRSRAIPYQEPEQAFAALDAVLEDNEERRSFVWHVLYGSGGSGKSRLALEYALERRTNTDDAIGFLDLQQAKTFDWEGWQSDRPTIVIIDYAARESELIGRMLQSLSSRDDLTNQVRLLMLERDMTASWFDRAVLRGSSSAHAIEACWSGEDGLVEPPTDLWPIIIFIAGSRSVQLPSQEVVLAELARIDPQMRPLYAAFLADAYARGEDPRRWDAYALVENVLQREKRFWADGGVQPDHINLAACATMSAGVPSEWIEHLTETSYDGFWPSWQGNQTIETLAAIHGEAIVADIPPLEPDILGEMFVLETWRAASKFEQSRMLHFGSYMAPWFAEFLERAVADFPSRPAFDLLYRSLNLDFKEYANAKPELIHNLVLALAKSEPDAALKVYWMFETLIPDQVTPNLPECVIDATFNLVVGSATLSYDDAWLAYRFQRLVSKNFLDDLTLDRSRCGLGASLLARFPGDWHDEFRTVLADALRAYRRFPSDKPVLQDTCVALSNYVCKLEEDHYAAALRLLKRFERIAGVNGHQDIVEARAEIRYHVFLLGLAVRKAETNIVAVSRAAFADLTVRAGVPDDAYQELVKRLSQDMADS